MPKFFRISDSSDVRDLGEQMAGWLAAGNPKAKDWAEQPEAPSKNAVWQNGAWAVPPVETVTAEQAVTAEKHIEHEGYPAIRLVTLMDLESKLGKAGKTCAKLAAVRLWLDMILGAFAANPEPRNDWPAVPFGFEETVQEALQ